MVYLVDKCKLKQLQGFKSTCDVNNFTNDLLIQDKSSDLHRVDHIHIRSYSVCHANKINTIILQDLLETSPVDTKLFSQ